MTCEASAKFTFSPAAASGPLLPDSPGGPTTAPSGPAPARASRSRRRGNAEVPTIQGTCGPTSFASSVPAGPLSSWENRLRARLATVGSTECALIWREKATPAGGSISRLAPWTPPTSASGSTGSPLRGPAGSPEPKPWNTPQAMDGNKGSLGPRPHDTGESLPQQIAGTMGQWPTPRASDGEKGGPNQSFGAGGQPLPSQMHQASPWVTPSARDWKDTPGMATATEDGRSRLDQLPRQMAAAWPTPTLADVAGGRKSRSGARSGELLMNGLLRGTAPSGQVPNGSPATTARPGAPNPVFACWLMGFPAEWVSGALRAMQSLPRSRRR